MSKQKSFMGVPIIGDTSHGRSTTTQRPIEEFRPLVAALLEDEFFVDFGWTQYTPYFNDGDVCEFGAHGLWVRTMHDVDRSSADVDEDDYDEDDHDSFSIEYGKHPTLGEYDRDWSDETRSYGPKYYVGEHQDKRNIAEALEHAIGGGAFDHVLLELFGDHCSVTISRDKITVEEYTHD